jgi:hypothetical protein
MSAKKYKEFDKEKRSYVLSMRKNEFLKGLLTVVSFSVSLFSKRESY